MGMRGGRGQPSWLRLNAAPSAALASSDLGATCASCSKRAPPLAFNSQCRLHRHGQPLNPNSLALRDTDRSTQPRPGSARHWLRRLHRDWQSKQPGRRARRGRSWSSGANECVKHRCKDSQYRTLAEKAKLRRAHKLSKWCEAIRSIYARRRRYGLRGDAY